MPPSVHSDLWDRLQALLGRGYRVERELPSGGMSQLFLATDLSLDRSVVVKVLPPELAGDVNAARFQREIAVAARFQHPHILPILSAGADESLLYYIMPFVDGESLRARLARGRLRTGEAISLLRDVACALAYAHGRGIVHRDIKPENVLLSSGTAVVADFGIAKAINVSRTATAPDDVATTLTRPGSSHGLKQTGTENLVIMINYEQAPAAAK